MTEELIMIDVIATCRTEGCAYNGVPSELRMPSPENPGTHTVGCAQCGKDITDVVSA